MRRWQGECLGVPAEPWVLYVTNTNALLFGKPNPPRCHHHSAMGLSLCGTKAVAPDASPGCGRSPGPVKLEAKLEPLGEETWSPGAGPPSAVGCQGAARLPRRCSGSVWFPAAAQKESKTFRNVWGMFQLPVPRWHRPVRKESLLLHSLHHVSTVHPPGAYPERPAFPTKLYCNVDVSVFTVCK